MTESNPATPPPANTELQPFLAELLRRLHQGELTAEGPDRRPAFRLSREVIGAAIAQGVPARQIAVCLGVTVGSIRDRRSNADGLMEISEVEHLTGLTPEAINQRSSVRLKLAHDHIVETYLISDVVRAVLARPEPSPTPASDRRGPAA